MDALYKLEPKVEILFIGLGNDVEKKLVSSYAFEYKTITAGKFRRYGRSLSGELADIKTSGQNLADVAKISRGYLQAKKILKRFKPNVVFTKGGFVTVPVGLAADHLKIPLIIHDSDAVFGMSSKILAKRAQKIATGFPESAFSNYAYVDKIVFTGNPVRKELLTVNPAKAKSTFGFNNTKPTVFIFGGSQGAAAINQVVFDGLELILKNYNIIHHTGSQGIEQARVAAHQLSGGVGLNYRPYDFLQAEMAEALFVANLAIIRASASSIAEVAAHSKPTIIIPNPNSANQHQQVNAEFVEKLGAARVLDQKDLTPIRLCSEIDKILSNKKAKDYLQTNIHELWVPDAAQRVATLILRAGE